MSGLYLATLLLLFYFVAPTTIFAGQDAEEYTFMIPAALNAPEVKITKGIPIRLVVPNSDIDLEIIDGVYNPDDKSWNVSPRKVHYALESAPANDYGGNTFIYGHNNPKVLGKLSRLKPGDSAQVHTANGLIFTYTLTASKDYLPEDASIFSYQGKPILTLQTCAGVWNELRRIYTFNLESVSGEELQI